MTSTFLAHPELIWLPRRSGRRIAQVHLIAAALAAHPSVQLDLATVQTNIVVLRLRAGTIDAATLVQRARERGVLVNAFDARTIRAVTHLDVSREQAEHAGAALRELLG